MRHWRWLISIALVSTLMGFEPAWAGPDDPVIPLPLKRVGVSEKLDSPIPLDAQFRDHTGRVVSLRDLVDGKRPLVLTFAYHSCPVLCGMVLTNATSAFRELDWTMGNEFSALTISIDPTDSLERTASKRSALLAQYGRPGADGGWQFLLGDKSTIDRVTSAVGFEYTYDAETRQYGHPSLVIVLKPDGRVSRYIYGLEFNPKDLKLALLEASEGKSRSTLEQVILYCYRYDAQEGKYVIMANRVMKLGAGLTVVALGSFLGVLWMRERKRNGLLTPEESGKRANDGVGAGA